MTGSVKRKFLIPGDLSTVLEISESMQIVQPMVLERWGDEASSVMPDTELLPPFKADHADYDIPFSHCTSSQHSCLLKITSTTLASKDPENRL